MPIRLNKFLAQAGVASRRKADKLITDGRVRVNGQVVEQLGVRVDEARDRVEVDGRTVRISREHVYLMLNKPAGALVTMDDPFGRRTVKHLIPDLPGGVVPVGRLDLASEGLLLLTSDGPLAFRLTHPRYEVKKTYIVHVDGPLTPEAIARLERGVVLDGSKTAPARIIPLESSAKRAILKVEIHEGRKREVRRMFEALGRRVRKLRRVAFAGLALKSLAPGHWRPLLPREVAALRKQVGLESGPAFEKDKE